MNRGYAGFYKGYYLRSSYEYAYAKFLDYHSISWKYELDLFDIGYRIYKPDFFLYNSKNDLYKIVEIKSRNEIEMIKAQKALHAIENLFEIKTELISYKELLKLYKGLPFSLNSIITEWISSENTTINKSAFGELNGHYNRSHTLETRRRIGKNTKKLWASDSIAKQNMVEGLKKSGLSQKGKLKTPRETRQCIECSKTFIVMISSTQKFCSQTCAGNSAIRNATVAYVNKRNQIKEDIKNYIIRWSEENKEIVLAATFNKISPTLSPLLKDIQDQFGVKDLRVISNAVFGQDRGRKELLKFMKNVCNEKIC
ncbi:PDDEXK family nuclease [Oceanobacillus damuensis]|uniref:restriction endonuclease n=1 Tax=Oceanobacillus damuensis TaxID=937928 RepID=UPI00082D1A09|nr:restriction endonuclease [Oceanobacillus damuensis]